MLQDIFRRNMTLKNSITFIAVFVSLFHIYQTRWMLLPLDQHKVIHVACGLTFVFLGSLMKTKGEKYDKFQNAISIILCLIAITLSSYIVINYYNIVIQMGVPRKFDLIVGGILVLLVLEGTRRIWGPVIPAIVLAGLAYGYFGAYFPGIFFHSGIRLPRLIAYSSIYFQGIFGTLTGESAGEVFMFILYGCILDAAGGIDFFMKIARKVGGRLRSGPAQAAVIGSALMGTISGSVAANVSTTGKITIPLMIKNGYSRELAGAVEAVASTGGQLMPPVMGVVAFIMASTTNHHYFQICQAALFPALIYYIYLAITIQIRALNKNIPIPQEEKLQYSLFKEIKKNSYLVISLFVLIFCLATYMPPSVAAFNAVLALFFSYSVKIFLVRKNVKSFIKEMTRFVINSLSDGAQQATKLGLILACLGILVEIFVITGFAQKVSFQMIELSGGKLISMLFLIAITCILFGMGMPTIGTYMVVSVLAAPALVKLGIPILSAHMFVFYFGLMAMVTPPVGVGVLVATGIAESNYLKTAFNATKLALPGFILPFFFIFRPEILWVHYPTIDSFLAFIFILSGLICLAAFFERHLFFQLNRYEMITFLVMSLLLLTPGKISSLLGLILFLFVLIHQFIKWKNQTTQS